MGMDSMPLTATLEGSVMVSYTTKRTFTMQSSNHAPWYLPKKGGNFRLYQNLHTAVFNSFIHNYPNQDAL